MDLYGGYGFGIDRNEKIEKGLDDEKKRLHTRVMRREKCGQRSHTEGAEREQGDENGLTSSHSPALHSRFV